VWTYIDADRLQSGGLGLLRDWDVRRLSEGSPAPAEGGAGRGD